MKIKHLFIPLVCAFCTAEAQQKGRTVYYDSSYYELSGLNAINSEYDDYGPIIKSNNILMYFTSNKPTTQSGNRKKEQIYVVSKTSENSEWDKPELLTNEINIEKRNNSVVFLDEKGGKLYVYRDANNGHGNILVSTISNNSYSEPAELPFNSKFHESSVCFTPDGNGVFLISEIKGGTGKRDIWYSKKQKNGEWGQMENIKELNTPEDEEAIHLDENGKTIYFSSKGHNSAGGYDIFKSELKNNKWTKPERMPEPINSDKDDLFYHKVKETAYFSSNRGGNYDIYTYRVVTTKIAKFIPDIEISLKAICKDKLTGSPVKASIEIVDVDNNSIIANLNTDSTEGKTTYLLPKKRNFRLNVNAPEYMFVSENFTVSDTTVSQVIEKIVPLSRIEKGTKVVLKNIFFDTDKATIRPESFIELNELVSFLNDNKNITIEISGHTDNVGSDEYNLKLSSNRAESVYNYLLDKKIPKASITYKGYGEKQPIDSNDTDEGKQNNRRTEFKILSVKK